MARERHCRRGEMTPITNVSQASRARMRTTEWYSDKRHLNVIALRCPPPLPTCHKIWLCMSHTHTHVLLGHRSWRVNQQHRFHRNTLQNITYLFIVTCGTHCIILLLQLELFPSLQPNQPEATWHLSIACFSLALFSCFVCLFLPWLSCQAAIEREVRWQHEGMSW